MSIINEKDRQVVRELLQNLERPVKLLFFEKGEACKHCRDIDQLLGELVQLSDKLQLEKKNFDSDRELAAKLGVDKAPVVVLLGEGDRDYGIRFFGVPAGYEFSALLDDIKMVSAGDSGLAPETRSALAELTEPLNLQVFVTPT